MVVIASRMSTIKIRGTATTALRGRLDVRLTTAVIIEMSARRVSDAVTCILSVA